MTGFREPSTALALNSLTDFDPRDQVDGGLLIQASRNAYPIVAVRQGRDSVGLMAGGAVAMVLGLLTFWTMSDHRSPRAAQPSPVAQTPVAPLAAPETGRPLVAAPLSGGTLIMPHTQPYERTQPFVTPQPVQPAREPMIVFDAGASTASATSTAQGQAPATAAVSPATLAAAAEASTVGDGTGKSGKSDDDGFFTHIDGRNAQVAVARQLSNPSTTVTQGTLIGAVLETSINTDLPGYVRALVSRDVKSFDGSQVLIPRSSRLIGQYKSGLSSGQTRAYVIWTRLIRPDGVSVTLDSPGTDFAGESGLHGKVNSHFMKRFGSALLLSVVGGLSAIGTGGASIIAGGGPSAASVAAGRDGAIAPTIRVLQGEPIRIFIARDLDFSSVPRLEASR